MGEMGRCRKVRRYRGLAVEVRIGVRAEREERWRRGWRERALRRLVVE